MATKERKCIRMKISDRELSINHLYRVPEGITEDRAKAYVDRGCAEWTDPPKAAVAPDSEPEENDEWLTLKGELESEVESLETEKASLQSQLKEQSVEITRLGIEIVNLKSEPAPLPDIPEKPDTLKKTELVALLTQIREQATVTPETEKRG